LALTSPTSDGSSVADQNHGVYFSFCLFGMFRFYSLSRGEVLFSFSGHWTLSSTVGGGGITSRNSKYFSIESRLTGLGVIGCRYLQTEDQNRRNRRVIEFYCTYRCTCYFIISPVTWTINLHLNLYRITCRTPCELVYVTRECGFVSCYVTLKSHQCMQISSK
jgi:hypothetical protein